MTKEPDRYCDKCGQKIRKLNPHHMDKAKLGMLRDIALLNTAGHPWVKVQRDGSLITPAEAARTLQRDDVHCRRLLWFGLLEERGRRSGEYRVTARGFGFLAGRCTVPGTIWCLNGAVYQKSAAQVVASQVKGVVLDKAYWDNYAQQQGYV